MLSAIVIGLPVKCKRTPKSSPMFGNLPPFVEFNAREDYAYRSG